MMAGVLQNRNSSTSSRRNAYRFADEKMLIPVLHGIAGKVDALNVTMGFH